MRRPIASPLVIATALLAACGSSSSSSSTTPPVGGGPGEACTAAADCQSGLACFSLKCAVAAPAAATCTLPHTPTVVLGAVAGPAADPGACLQSPQPVAFTGVDAEVIDLGTHATGDVVSLTLPDGTVSFSVVSQAVTGSTLPTLNVTQGGSTFQVPDSVVPTDVFAPGSATKFFDDTIDPGIDPSANLAYYGGFTPVAGAFTVPDTSPSIDLVRSAGQLPAGAWSLRVNDFARECASLASCTLTPSGAGPVSYQVSALVKKGAVASTGTLDLDLYVVSADPSRHPVTGTQQQLALGYTAAKLLGTSGSSTTSAQFQRLVQDLATVFAKMGLCLGTITVHDVQQWVQDKYYDLNIDSTGPCDPLSQLFALSAGSASGRAVHLFLVDALTFTPSAGQIGVVVGIDGSIPGPSGVPGTINSGAAVSFADFGLGSCNSSFSLSTCGTDEVSYIMAHETGHWLGLYHTTESTVTLFDPLTDTLKCPCSSCADSTVRSSCGASTQPAQVTAANCRTATCGGGDDLMFWLLDQASRATLTSQQGEVVRLNPAVR